MLSHELGALGYTFEHVRNLHQELNCEKGLGIRGVGIVNVRYTNPCERPTHGQTLIKYIRLFNYLYTYGERVISTSVTYAFSLALCYFVYGTSSLPAYSPYCYLRYISGLLLI